MSTRNINRDLLTGDHAWQTTPAGKDMDRFATHVLSENAQRPDMARFQMLAEKFGAEKVIRIWYKFVDAHPWFTIPDSLNCSRTFARDEMDAVYVDQMDIFQKKAAARTITVSCYTIPLSMIEQPVVGRWWNSFWSRRYHYIETLWRIKHGVFICADSFDVPLEDVNLPMLRLVYPSNPDWWEQKYFPAGVPCLTPPSVFYYHTSMSCATNGFWYSVLQHEYALLYASGWWHEAARGHRAFILPFDTIQWLQELLDDVVIDREMKNGGRQCTSFEWVAQQMRSIASTPARHRNILQFPDQSVSDCYFIWCERGTAFRNLNEVGGRRFSWSRNGRLVEEEVARDVYGKKPKINRRQPRPERR